MDLLRKLGKHVEDLIADLPANAAPKQAAMQGSAKSVAPAQVSAPSEAIPPAGVSAKSAVAPAQVSAPSEVIPPVGAAPAASVSATESKTSETPLKADQKRDGVMCTKKCQNLSCPRKHPPCLNFDNCRVKATCPYLHSDGTRVPPVLSATPSPAGPMCSKKCANLSCPKNHPPCRNYDNCPTKATCPFLHSDGSRVPPTPSSGPKAEDEKEEAAGPEVDSAVRLHVADVNAGEAGKTSRRQRKAERESKANEKGDKPKSKAKDAQESKANEKGDKSSIKAKDTQRLYKVVVDLVSVFGNKLSGDARLPLSELDRLCQLHYADNASHMRLPFPDLDSLLPLLPLDQNLRVETDVCIFSNPLPACPDLIAAAKCLKPGCILQHKCPFTNKACPRADQCKLMHRQVRAGEGQKLAVEIVSLYGGSRSGPVRTMPLSKFEELLRILPEKEAGSLSRSTPELLEQILRPGILTLNDGVLTAHSPVDACLPSQSNLPCAQTPCPLRHKCLFPREACPLPGCTMAHKSKDAKNAQPQKLVCEVVSLYGNGFGAVRSMPVPLLDALLHRLPAKVTGRLLKGPVSSLLPRIVQPKVLEEQDGAVTCFSPVNSCIDIRLQRPCTQVACPFRHKCMFSPQACPRNQACGMLHKATPPEGKPPKEKGEGKRTKDKQDSKPTKDKEGKPPKDREGKPPKDKEDKPPKDKEGRPPKDKDSKPPKEQDGKPPREKTQGEKKEGSRHRERSRHPETHESLNRVPASGGAPIKNDAAPAQRAPRAQRPPSDNASSQQATSTRAQKAPAGENQELEQWLRRKDLLDLWPHLKNTFDSVRTCQLAFKGLQAKEIRDELGLHGMSGLATAAKLREALDT